MHRPRLVLAGLVLSTAAIGGTFLPRASSPSTDETNPAIANLDSDLRAALDRATADAAASGVAIHVNSGWRSVAYQEQLFRKAVETYGSAAEAKRWVAPPDKSAHVTGDAIDVGPATATKWLLRNGARYGLCRIYRNEPWHFELRPAARTHGCPPMYADARALSPTPRGGLDAPRRR
jgi:hypothetical protein